MKDYGDAILPVAILVICLGLYGPTLVSVTLSAITGSCQQGNSGDCILADFVTVVGLALTSFGIFYVVIGIWRLRSKRAKQGTAENVRGKSNDA